MFLALKQFYMNYFSFCYCTFMTFIVYVNYLYYDWLIFVYQHSSHCCYLDLVKLLNTE